MFKSKQIMSILTVQISTCFPGSQIPFVSLCPDSHLVLQKATSW